MIKPVRDLVYITPIDDADVSPGGIIIPAQAKERIDQGIIKWIGPDVKDIKVGDYVIFPNYSGTMIYVEDEEDLLIIMQEDAVIAVLNEPRSILIPGLYFKDKEGDYFPASYTNAMRFITDAIQRNPLHRNMKFVPFDAPLLRKNT